MPRIITKGDWRRDLIALGPSTFVGLTLFVSGVGKIPRQTEFADLLLKSFWTPTMACLIAHALPVGEIILGLFLVFGIFPRIAAGLCLPLLIGFMANNALAISRGAGAFLSAKDLSCGCFGVWETLFGIVTPMQAMVYDVVLLMLAVIILVFHPTGFWHFRPWLIKKWKWEGIK